MLNGGLCFTRGMFHAGEGVLHTGKAVCVARGFLHGVGVAWGFFPRGGCCTRGCVTIFTPIECVIDASIKCAPRFWRLNSTEKGKCWIRVNRVFTSALSI